MREDIENRFLTTEELQIIKAVKNKQLKEYYIETCGISGKEKMIESALSKKYLPIFMRIMYKKLDREQFIYRVLESQKPLYKGNYYAFWKSEIILLERVLYETPQVTSNNISISGVNNSTINIE